MSKLTYIVTVGGLAALSFVGGLYLAASQDGSEVNLISAERKTLTQEVAVTGKTKPVQSLELAFEYGGVIRNAAVRVGSQVFAGQVLAQLDASELLARLEEAEASVKVQEAKLAELKAGTRAEELQIYQTKVSRAEQLLANAKQNLINQLNDAFAKADDAIRNKVDQFFSNPQTALPQLAYLPIYDQTKINLESERLAAEFDLKAFAALIAATETLENFETSLPAAKTYLNRFASLLNLAALAVNSAAPTPNLTQTTLNAWKADIAAGRNNLNAAITALASAGEAFKTSQSDLLIAQQELALKKAGATAEQILAQEAAILQARAQAENIKAQIAKTVIRSPLSGVVARQDAKPGQITAARQPLITVISPNDLEIEANVPEVDIGAVKIGDRVRVDFDAFPRENFRGTIAFIDPAETIIDGVVNFKVKIALTEPDPRLKSGLTASLAIQTVSKEDVLALPQFAILENDAGVFVRRLIKNGSTEDVPVELGIRGRDGYVEIIAGLADLEKVVNIGAKRSQ